MAMYKPLTPNEDLLFEQNITDNNELKTFIDAIADGISISFDYYYDDFDNKIYVKLVKSKEGQTKITDVVTFFKNPERFRKAIVNYAQAVTMAMVN